MSEHGGSGSRYSNAGCRCVKCTEANRTRIMRRREERYAGRVWVNGYLTHPNATHGTIGGHGNWGCRCGDCIAANADRCATWRANR